MMDYILFSLLAVAGLAALGGGVVLLLRSLLPRWWRHRFVRIGAYALPAITAVALLCWQIGFHRAIFWLIKPAGTALALGSAALILLLVLLPLAGALTALNRRLDQRSRRRSAPAPAPIDRARRQLLEGAALALPVIALEVALTGVVRSFQAARVYRRVMRFADLPEPLHGLRILHLTDGHAGLVRSLDDLADVVAAAASFQPHLVVLTGDAVDKHRLLSAALCIVASLRPPLGCHACLGNHEHLLGADWAQQIFQQSAVKLLRNEGVELDHRGGKIWLAGIDDPYHHPGDRAGFFDQAVPRALRAAPQGSFRILLTHRPQGFIAAARHGVDLTLAGHTHGGQVGHGGRSAAGVVSSSYWWGPYRRGQSVLYVCGGVGHWLPFRLGCYPEAPVIELRRA